MGDQSFHAKDLMPNGRIKHEIQFCTAVLKNAGRWGKWFAVKRLWKTAHFSFLKTAPSGVPLGLSRRKAEQTQNKTQQRRKKAALRFCWVSFLSDMR